MQKRKAIPKCTMAIDYLENSFTKEELLIIEDALKEGSIKLLTHSHTPKHIAGVEEFFPQIMLLLSPDIVSLICQGLLTNALYDALKTSVIHVYSAIKKKPLSRIQSGKIETDVIPNVHLKMGKASMLLPINLGEEKFKYCVDKMFEAINQDVVEHSYYLKYDEDKKGFECLTKTQIIGQAYSEWEQKQPKGEQQEDEATI